MERVSNHHVAPKADALPDCALPRVRLLAIARAGIVSGRPQHANLFESLVARELNFAALFDDSSESEVTAIERKQKRPPCPVGTELKDFALRDHLLD